MDPNRPNNNYPDPNRGKSSSVPNVPSNPPNWTSTTNNNYDMRGLSFTSVAGNVVNHHHTGVAPYHAGDNIYQQPLPPQPQRYPTSPPTGYPSHNPRPIQPWLVRSSSQGSQDSTPQFPPTRSPTSPAYASPSSTTNPMPQWLGNRPSEGDIFLLLSQLTRQPNIPSSHPTVPIDSQYHVNNIHRYHWASFR
jgi:hypothetical protein